MENKMFNDIIDSIINNASDDEIEIIREKLIITWSITSTIQIFMKNYQTTMIVLLSSLPK